MVLRSWERFDHSSDLLGPRAPRPQTRRRRAVFRRKSIFALRAHCGRGARGPSKSLEWSLLAQLRKTNLLPAPVDLFRMQAHWQDSAIGDFGGCLVAVEGHRYKTVNRVIGWTPHPGAVDWACSWPRLESGGGVRTSPLYFCFSGLIHSSSPTIFPVYGNQ